jgi:vacuolar-type H+-ATPase subunit E/Vma4
MSSNVEAFKIMVDKLLNDTKNKVTTIFNNAFENILKILSESEKYAISNYKEILSSYKERAEIESKKEISKTEMESRLYLLTLKDSCINKVIENVKSKLIEYCKSDEYIEIILEKLKKISKEIPIEILLMKEDDIKRIGIDKLKKILESSEIKSYPIEIGGFIIISRNGKLTINRTLDYLLEAEKQVLRSKIASILFR